jgi:hypothetical protein
MKDFYNVWKKYLLKEDVKTATNAVSQASKNKNAVKQYTDIQNQRAAAEEQQAKQELDIEKAKEQAEKAQAATAKTGTSGTTGTTGTVKEESVMSVGGRQDGAVGQQPVSVQEEELTEEEMEEASGCHEGMEEGGKSCQLELEYQETEEEKTCNECAYCRTGKLLTEAKYKGRTVPLGKPMRGDVKKFKVFVRDPKTGNVKKVNFGDKKMRIKKSNPKRRKSFRARHNCANPGPRTKARYWSCRKW